MALDVQIPETIRRMVADGALFVFNDSGGKDSQAMRIVLRGIVHRSQSVVVHASLGKVEWPGALEHAQAGAERDGIPFVVARATKTFFEMVERRHAARPDVPPWPSKKYRQCTSDLKRGPIEREVRRLLPEYRTFGVVSCEGIRAEESTDRAKRRPLERSERNSKAGRDWWTWLPILGMTEAEVFETIRAAGETPHPAYATGNRRLSCMFCILGGKGDLRNAAEQNPALYQEYVAMEERTGYAMHQSGIRLPVLIERKA